MQLPVFVSWQAARWWSGAAKFCMRNWPPICHLYSGDNWSIYIVIWSLSQCLTCSRMESIQLPTTLSNHIHFKHHTIPQQTQLFTFINFNNKHKLYSHNDIYQFCQISQCTAQQILASQLSEPDQWLKHHEKKKDPRPHESVIDADTLYQMHLFVAYDEFKDHALFWKALGAKAGLTGTKYVHWQTIKHSMETFNYHKRKAHHIDYIPSRIQELWVKFA